MKDLHLRPSASICVHLRFNTGCVPHASLRTCAWEGAPDAGRPGASGCMSSRSNKIAQAWLESHTRGVIELARDWRARHAPPISIPGAKLRKLDRVPDHTFGSRSGYFVNRRSEIYFFLREDAHPRPFARRGAVYLAGDFNGWGDAIGRDEWELRPASLDGEPVLLWSGDAERFFAHPPMRFKFVTAEG